MQEKLTKDVCQFELHPNYPWLSPSIEFIDTCLYIA